NCDVLYGATACPASSIVTYTAGASAAAKLENPLWYAAKYGSFNDSNANDIPDVTSEWDSKINADGSFGSDGIPDNFFKVTNPAELETQLESAFNDILGRVSAGTSVSVLSTNNTGGGALYQALYDPVEQVNSQTVTWGGRLHGLFVDSSGFLREDSNTGGGTLGKLDGYTQDNIVILYYDDVDKETKLCRYTNPATSITNYATDCDSIAPLDDLNTIWNARDTLANLDASTITLQRPYTEEISSAANKGRHIFTWVDTNTDGVIDNTEVVDFTAANFDTNSFGFLNVTTEAEADNIVEFIRGKEGITGYRSRTIDYDLDGTDEVWRLGDIIHSTPAVVGAPDANYGILYGDDTYSTFANKYLNRRQMIYVGANDGMLHAFNAGFYDENDKQFDLTVDLDDGSPAVSHPLGAEMWAYVPFNLLPHLKWLTETSYPHVYYVDGAPREFEVNIFPDDTDHPGGWGTILVVGMRLGGGDLSYDHDNNAGTANITTRSAYIVLDVTNPEVAPTLLAEISDPSLGFTTSTPSLVVDRTPGAGNDWSYGNTTTNNWYLAFGSGPNVLDTVTSTQNAKLYLYNLNTKTFKAGLAPQDLGIANSFVGDPTTVNWGSDFVDDVAYFGVVGGTESAPDGRLMRLVLSSDVTNTLLNTSQPFVSAPSAAIDETGRQWVYASSGRLYTGNDEGSTTQQTSYGIKEPQTSGVETYTTTITTASMQNVTGVQVYADSSVVDASPALLPAGTDTFSELITVVQAQNGWYTNFAYDGTNPSERNFTPSIQWRGLTLFTTYTPPASDSCSEGRSSLHALYYRTGTAYPNAGLGNDTSITNADGSPLTVTDIDLGTGTASQVTILPGSGGSSGSGSATVQMGTSAISGSNVTGIGTTGGRKSWRELDF
ncbi:MAG: PilC/PilY family type IV pilus protein, partial [Gammaproteobacteria bacterium]|nr:PilC/PilY family type IV pilus protein [Gammaproteobacteria bacterium]